MFHALVHFTCDNVIRNDVVEAAVGVIPLVAVERDSASPTVMAGIACRGCGDVPVVSHCVVFDHQVVALDRPYS